MTDFRTLTVMVNVRHGSDQAIRTLLDSYGDIVQTNNYPIAFLKSSTIHFARWVLVDPPNQVGTQIPTRLVLSCNHDGPRDKQLKEIIALSGPALDNIYDLCDGYPIVAARTDDSRLRYLQEHCIEVSSIFIGAPDRTLLQIRQESLLHDGITNFLNNHDFSGKSPLQVADEIRDFVFKDPALKWAAQPAPPRAVTLPQLVVFIAIALFFLPLVALWLLILRLCFERTDQPLNLMPSQLPPELLKSLERREDLYTQNQFSQLMEIKPGWFRQVTLKVILWTSNFLGRYFFKNGQINSIPSIHFYSWIILDNGTRLLFLSNFDGSWDSYLGDFIDKAAFGLNGVLSNCAGFPKTDFLFFKGVTDVEHYKAWARNANIPTQIWYTAYPHLNVKNINLNSTIRLGLRNSTNDAEAATWLKSL